MDKKGPSAPGWRPETTQNGTLFVWPDGWPRMGEVWEVIQREVFPRDNGTRE